MASRKQQGTMTPGFGLPLKWQQEGKLPWQYYYHNTFLNSALDGSEGDYGDGNNPLTVVERVMLSLMNEITDEFGWISNVLDKQYMDKWKHLVLSRYAKLSPQIIEWCIQEVQERAVQFNESQIIPALDHGVYKSDTIISSALKNNMRASIERLERSNKNDSIQPSKTMESSVVDPSLYPLNYGKTRYRVPAMSQIEDSIRLCGNGRWRYRPHQEENGSLKGKNFYAIDNAWSTKYQWLPCDIQFDEDTGKPRITSYINNVHPLHNPQLYKAIDASLSCILPMFNFSLMALKKSELFDRRIDPDERTTGRTWPDLEPGPYRSLEQRAQSDCRNAQGGLKRSVRVDLQKEFWDVGIQLVVQVSTINLDTESPEFLGEEWHVQGQMNERICGTVLYCYSSSNIAEAKVLFRHRVSNDDPMILNIHTSTTKECEDAYGIKDLGPAVQVLGEVLIREDRTISFPNVFQTKISPFKLRDPSKPGHLKLFIFHLVDPNRRIMSTSMVPCQQQDWWAREIRQRVPVLRRLPVEIFDSIVNMVDDFPISREEAEKIRKELVQERGEL